MEFRQLEEKAKLELIKSVFGHGQLIALLRRTALVPEYVHLSEGVYSSLSAEDEISFFLKVDSVDKSKMPQQPAPFDVLWADSVSDPIILSIYTRIEEKEKRRLFRKPKLFRKFIVKAIIAHVFFYNDDVLSRFNGLLNSFRDELARKTGFDIVLFDVIKL